MFYRCRRQIIHSGVSFKSTAILFGLRILYIFAFDKLTFFLSIVVRISLFHAAND